MVSESMACAENGRWFASLDASNGWVATSHATPAPRADFEGKTK